MLEDIALYMQYKPPSFLRHFGFVSAVGQGLDNLEKQTQEICLFILFKMSQDSVLVQEIFEDGIYKALKKLALGNDMRIRLAALKALDPVCIFPAVQNSFVKKVEAASHRNSPPC